MHFVEFNKTNISVIKFNTHSMKKQVFKGNTFQEVSYFVIFANLSWVHTVLLN